ncbi:hypothetical protein NDU88_003378 [Pleurodeles waltl]|uniref:Uncharacterized protein n=1 Tax=Pleurodeles waltl TaxID=8319 RepID=A0AAV7T4L9_PLEWA|nr:hypothetical protein NDU88_003378 [Pleurodeles waltl]
MAAPSGFSVISEAREDLQSGVDREVGEDTVCEDVVIVLDSDDDLETGHDFYDEGCSQSLPMSFRLPLQVGKNIQWIPRQVSPMVHRVQEWEVSNQSVLRAGEQVDFVNEQGAVIRGPICGAAMDDGASGSAQVWLDFWQQGERAYRPGCDVPHALGGHEMAAAGQRLGRPAVFSRPVEVRAPLGHRVEERVQPGTVRLTSRKVPVSGEGSSASNAGGLRSFPASQGALSGLTGEEEALDYEEEDTSRPTTVTKTSSSKKAVPGDRLAGGKNVLSSNLIRVEVTNTLGAVGAVSGKKVVGDNLNNVDVAIQVEDVGVQEGKRGSLSGAIDAVSGKQDLTQVSMGQSGVGSGEGASGGSKAKKLPYMGVSMALGGHLTQSLKEKIWRGEFIDVFKLLHREVQAKEGSKEEEWELARRHF